MAKQLCTLEHCLSMTGHHLSPEKVKLMMSVEDIEKVIKYRFELVRQNTIAALSQLKKIRKAAKDANCTEVLRLLDEESVPAGHDYR